MSDHITELLDDIDRLDQQAEPGPWSTDESDEEVGVIWGGPRLDHGYIKQPMITSYVEGEGNAEFIALARTSLPQLAKAIRAVTEYCQKMSDPFLAGQIMQAITNALKGDDDAEKPH